MLNLRALPKKQELQLKHGDGLVIEIESQTYLFDSLSLIVDLIEGIFGDVSGK